MTNERSQTTSTVFAELGGPTPPADERSSKRPFLIEALPLAETANNHPMLSGYHRLRQEWFVERQGLFDASDLDDLDDAELSPHTIVLVASKGDELLGGVRIHPTGEPGDGWWVGSRLATADRARLGVGAALVRAACARAQAEGAIRFDATVQHDKEQFFNRLGWLSRERIHRHGLDHVAMSWPIDRFAPGLAAKAPIGRLFADAKPGGAWLGDDGVPVPGSDVVAVTDAILPSMVERDPWWAGWCSVLVNANDLAAMGAAPVGLLDAIGAPTESLAQRVVAGMTDAASAWGVSILGGHTQVGVPASLSITMLGRTDRPVPGGGASPGMALVLVADLTGRWRPGYGGRQWDSTSSRTPDELARLHRFVADAKPSAAKDVSMAGLVGTVGMMAEASGAGARIELADVPRPSGTNNADWLTCFPGYAMVMALPETDLGVVADLAADLPQGVTLARIGSFTDEPGVALEWADGFSTQVVPAAVTGLGQAGSGHRQQARPPKAEPRPEERS